MGEGGAGKLLLLPEIVTEEGKGCFGKPSSPALTSSLVGRGGSGVALMLAFVRAVLSAGGFSDADGLSAADGLSDTDGLFGSEGLVGRTGDLEFVLPLLGAPHATGLLPVAGGGGLLVAVVDMDTDLLPGGCGGESVDDAAVAAVAGGLLAGTGGDALEVAGTNDADVAPGSGGE